VIDSPPAPPPPRPSLPFTVAWTIFALLSFLVVGGTAQMMQLAWGLWFSEIVVFCGLAVIGFQIARLSPLRAMGLQAFDARTFGLGFLFGLVNYVAWAVPLMAAAQRIFPKAMVDQFDSSQVFERASSTELAIVLVGVSVAAPLGEEMIFRGFFQRGLVRQWGAPVAIGLTAFVFSAFHLDPVGLAARFELGVLFGVLAWRAGSLWPALAAHGANNLISSLLFLGAGDAKEEDLAWWVPVLMFIFGNLALMALVRFARPRLVRPAEDPVLASSGEQLAVWPLFRPWIVAATASVALLLALDWRGVQLNLLDAQLQPGKSVSKRAEVKELRARVRRGEAGFRDYELLIKALKAG